MAAPMAGVPYEELLLAPRGPQARFYELRAPPPAAGIASASASASPLASAPGAARGVVCVGGVGGGWDSPGAGLYPRLCKQLASRGEARGLRVRFRVPTSVPECAADVIDGLEALAARGVTRAVLLGHSLGGAVVVAAAAAASALPAGKAPAVSGVVALSTQLAGATAPAAQLAPPTRLLVLHAADDGVLSPACSERLVRAATQLPPADKTLRILPTGGHGLAGGGAEMLVFDEVAAFVRDALGISASSSGGGGA
jgi:pimeloyl-ACP methyl ester carboxylesterase